MINSVGQNSVSSADLSKLREGGKAGAAAGSAGKSSAVPLAGGVVSTPAARMAAEGAPVDTDRVSAIKDAIASGNYPVDPDRIAQSMIELDLDR